MNISNDGVNRQLFEKCGAWWVSDTVFNECRKGFYPTAFGMWNVFSPCFDWMDLVADLFKNTEVNSCSSNTRWWYLRPARGAGNVELSWSVVWLSVLPKSYCWQHSTACLKELKNMRTPPWGGSLAFGGELLSLGVPQHSVGSNAQHGFACLLLHGSKSYCSLLLFLYTLHGVEAKIRYKHRVHQSLLTQKTDCDRKSSFCRLLSGLCTQQCST